MESKVLKSLHALRKEAIDKERSRKAIWKGYSWRLNRLYIVAQIEFAVTALVGVISVISRKFSGYMGVGPVYAGILTVISSAIMTAFLIVDMASWILADFIAKAEVIMFLTFALALSLTGHSGTAVINAACGFALHFVWRRMDDTRLRRIMKGGVKNARR